MESANLRVDTVNVNHAGGMQVGLVRQDIKVTHIPTGIVAQCGTARSQHRNRAICIAMIMTALEYGESTK